MGEDSLTSHIKITDNDILKLEFILVSASFSIFSRSWHGNGARKFIDQWFKFRIFNSLMSDIIIIDDIMALILSAPPETRLDQTPHNNDTELNKSYSN